MTNVRADRRMEVYLHPGQIFVSSGGETVTTILGSCIAVCVWDDVRHLGGINHFLLPHWAGTDAPNALRFGNVAVTRLLDEMRARGSTGGAMRAKVFGGACVLDAFREVAEHVGVKNARAALAALEQERIAVVERDVGGPRGRKLTFRLADGATRCALI